MSYKNDFNLFVGGVTGAFKGIQINQDGLINKNLQNIKILKPENEITSMIWGDDNETDILIGTAGQCVKIYDSEFKAYSTSIETKYGNGPIVGITRVNESITTCSESGHIKVWKYRKEEEVELEAKGNVSHMRSPKLNSGIVATGGKDNGLKLWNLETKSTLFQSRNVKKTELELEVPIWVSDIAFIPDTDYKVAVSTRHGQIRLYDTKAARRPVIDIQVPKYSFTTISLCCNENQVIVGSGSGDILQADLRNKGKVIHALKGSVGSIRSVACHPQQPYVTSVGLDRFLRIHRLNTRELMHEEYLKVKLNCILMRSNFQEKKIQQENKTRNESDDECKVIESDDEYDDIFQNMETVGCKTKDEPAFKRKRKETAGDVTL